MTTLAPDLEAFFTDRLLCQRNVSPNTIACYRDTFRLLLSFMQQKTGTPPAKLQLTDLDAPTIGAFLEHLEKDRGNTARTRNIRLAAVRSFFQYCALRHPEHAHMIQRVLAIPAKRSERRIVTFLTPDEITALLKSPDRTTWAGRRDHAIFRTAFGVCPLTVGAFGRCVDLPSGAAGAPSHALTRYLIDEGNRLGSDS